MLQRSCALLGRPMSKQHVRTGFHLLHGKGHRYDSTVLRMYANHGWGMGAYTPRKDRRWPTTAFREAEPETKPENMPRSNTTKTLSPEWRPFALSDGGVLFLHPTRDEVLQWNHKVLVKEREATGMATRDHDTVAKMQALIADNTLEHVSLAEWRREQMKQLVMRHAGSRQGHRLPQYQAMWK